MYRAHHAFQLRRTASWSCRCRCDFAADFRDMFEVRGIDPQPPRPVPRGRDGERIVAFRYDGLDGSVRQSAISFSQAPDAARRADRAEFLPSRVPKRGSKIALSSRSAPEMAEPPDRERFRAAAARARFGMRAKRRQGATVHSSGRVFNDWLDARPRRHRAADHRPRRPGPTPMPAFPGSRRRSAATASSRPCRCCGSTPAWRAACWHSWRGTRRRRPRRSAIPSPARSCTRPARARWRCCASCRSGATMAASTRRRSTSISPAPMPTAPATWSSSTVCGRRCSRPPTGWRRRPRDGDGFVTYKRAAESGLANQGWKDSFDSVFHADGRIPQGPIALVEVQGYVFAAYPGPGRAGRAGAARTTAAEHWDGLRRSDARRGRTRILDGGSRLLRAGDRRRRQAVRGADLECRPSALCRPARAGAGADGRRPAAVRRISTRLGRAHAGRRRVFVQPDVLPQRLDLAARHRDLRAPGWRATASATAWSG